MGLGTDDLQFEINTWKMGLLRSLNGKFMGNTPSNDQSNIIICTLYRFPTRINRKPGLIARMQTDKLGFILPFLRIILIFLSSPASLIYRIAFYVFLLEEILYHNVNKCMKWFVFVCGSCTIRMIYKTPT